MSPSSGELDLVKNFVFHHSCRTVGGSVPGFSTEDAFGGHPTVVPKTPLRIPHALSLTICGKLNQSQCVQRAFVLLPCTSQEQASFYFLHSPFSLVIKSVPSGGADDPGTSSFKLFAPQASHHISSLDLGLYQWDFAPRLSFLSLLPSLMDWS